MNNLNQKLFCSVFTCVLCSTLAWITNNIKGLNLIKNTLPCYIFPMTSTSQKEFPRNIMNSLFTYVPARQLSWYILFYTDNGDAHSAQVETLSSHSPAYSEHDACLNRLHYHGLQDSMVLKHRSFSSVDLVYCNICTCNGLYYEQSCGSNENMWWDRYLNIQHFVDPNRLHYHGRRK